MSQRFTGKERDVETGLDYFGARYLSSAQGRWTSPDWSAAPEPVPYASLGEPQTLNLYAYVKNNPTSNRDLDGHWCWFGRIGNTCGDKNIPPPPKPKPTKPPAVITPGTPQNRLAQAQDSARANPAFAPVGRPGSRNRRTFCNYATCNIATNTDAPLGPLENDDGNPNVANVDYNTLADPASGYHEVTPEEAQELANQGVTVIGVQENPGVDSNGNAKHGHILTVRPELMPGLAEMLGQAPLVNNIGGRREVAPASGAFSSSRPVKYYAPNK